MMHRRHPVRAASPDGRRIAGAVLAVLALPVLVNGFLLVRAGAGEHTGAYAQLPGAVVLLIAVIMAGADLLRRAALIRDPDLDRVVSDQE